MEHLAGRGAMDEQRWRQYQDVRDNTALSTAIACGWRNAWFVDSMTRCLNAVIAINWLVTGRGASSSSAGCGRQLRILARESHRDGQLSSPRSRAPGRVCFRRDLSVRSGFCECPRSPRNRPSAVYQTSDFIR
jgi:hypothetical protein